MFSASDKMNEVVKILTIFAGIVILRIFIAGIYGIISRTCLNFIGIGDIT